MEQGPFCDASVKLFGNLKDKKDVFVRHYYASIFVAKIWRNIQNGDVGGDYIHLIFDHGPTLTFVYEGFIYSFSNK